jgi:hypothetical protein
MRWVERMTAEINESGLEEPLFNQQDHNNWMQVT